METSSEEFRLIYLPYCIEQREGGGYVALNRLYKPLGTRARDWIDYAPPAVTLKGLTASKTAQISHAGSNDTARIYLYGDASKPTGSAAA